MDLRPEQVPAILRQLRSDLGYSRARLAELLGSTPAKVFNLEKGRTPSGEELTAVATLVASAATKIETFADPGTPLVEAATATEPASEPTPEPSTAVDWSALRQAAASVSESSAEPPEPAPPSATTPESPSPVPDDGVRRFSNSEIQTYKRCRRKWWLGWYRGLHAVRPDLAGVRSTGTRIHLALAGWYVPDGETRVDPRETLERVIREDTELMLRHDATPQEIDKLEKANALERAMVEGYVEWLQETGVDSTLKITAAEQYLEAWLREFEQPTKIIGKLDVRATRTSDDVRLFIDHKSVGEFMTPMQWLHMNEQLLQYMLLEYLCAYEEELERQPSSQSLDRSSNVSGAQSASSVAVSLLHEDDHDGDGTTRLGGAPSGRGSREQSSDESGSSASRMSQLSSQQGSKSTEERGSQGGTEQSGETSQATQVDGGVESENVGLDERDLAKAARARVAHGALYNMLRRVKRTGTAKPPFYDRLEVRHNHQTIEAFKQRLIGTITDIYRTEELLRDLPEEHTYQHLSIIYPTATENCRWQCEFFAVCSLFDDGSRAEAMLSQFFEKGDPLEYYQTQKRNGDE